MSDRGGQTTKQTYVTRYSTDVDPRTLPDFKQRGVYRPADNSAAPDPYYNNNNDNNQNVQPYNNNNNNNVSLSRSSQSASELNSYTSDGHRLRKKYTVTTVTTVTTTTILLPNMQDAVVMPSNTTYQIEDSNNDNNNHDMTYNANGQARNALLIQAAPSQSTPYNDNENNNNYNYKESSRREMMSPYAPQSAAATTSAPSAPCAPRNIQQQQQPPPQEYVAAHNPRNGSRALVPLPASDPTAHALARPAAGEAPGNAAQWRFVQNNTTATNQAVCYDKPPTLAELGIASYFDHNDVNNNNDDDDGAHHRMRRRNEAGNGMRTSATSLPESSASAPRRTSQSPLVNKETTYARERMPRPQKPVRYVPGEEYVQGGGRTSLAPYVTQETRSELEGGTYSRR